jgi:hypothetical protein
MKRLHSIEIVDDAGEFLINGKSWEQWSLEFLWDLTDEIADIRMGSEAIAENAPESQRYLAQEAYEEDCRREQLIYSAVGLLRYWFRPSSVAETKLIKIAQGRGDDEAQLARIDRALLELGVKFRGEAPPGCGELL